MTHSRKANLLALLALLLAGAAQAGGRYFKVEVPPSDRPGELKPGVTYRLWVPDGVTKLRGIVVHQHGCGTGACRGGETAAEDLHWQALARKWDCALMGPSYHQDDQQSCALWCDPRNGSARTFLHAIKELAKEAQHAELEQVPWCLWGHSGGGFWASLMMTLYPERVVAVWLRSGTALGQPAQAEIPELAYRIPVMCNPGIKEKGDRRFNGAWTGALAMFKAFRARGAPIGLAADPRTSHECGDSRYLAIPFFDACLALRLPDPDGKDQKLRLVDIEKGWLGDMLGERAQPAAAYRGKTEEAVWLPDERVSRAWMEYVKKGNVGDDTPPPPPVDVEAKRSGEGAVEVRWDAEADLESGLQGFAIERDGKDIGRLPEKPIGHFGRPLFQTMSYHDTPERPVPRMRYLDPTSRPGTRPSYRVIAINSVGLKSAPSKAASPLPAGGSRP